MILVVHALMDASIVQAAWQGCRTESAPTIAAVCAAQERLPVRVRHNRPDERIALRPASGARLGGEPPVADGGMVELWASPGRIR